MDTSRRNFITRTGFTAASLCGFALRGLSITPQSKYSQVNLNPEQLLMQDWVATLLENMPDTQGNRNMMKRCAKSHYDHLGMELLLEPFVGKLDEFNAFITEKWGWIIDYRKEVGLLIANENKSICVCPMVNKEKGLASSTLCFCSEGFAELMFSKVLGYPVKAIVISSVLRGDSSCKYQIDLVHQ